MSSPSNQISNKATPRRIFSHNERGIALLMAIFLIAFSTIIVMEMASRSRYDLKSLKSFQENIQGLYVIKSATNLGRTLLSLPKNQGIKEDWLKEPWSLTESIPKLDFPGTKAEFRLAIIDEDGKVDLNSIFDNSFPPPPAGDQNAAPPPRTNQVVDFWMNALRRMFSVEGFVKKTYPKEQKRTQGNNALAAGDQVATIRDWIDSDSSPFRQAGFEGQGIESSKLRGSFYNRRFRNINELLLVPGMTKERFTAVAPYLRVSGRIEYKVNVNTAPKEVLFAMGFAEGDIEKMLTNRMNLPFTQDSLKNLSPDPNIIKSLKVTSASFIIYVRVSLPNISKLGKIIVNAPFANVRQTNLRSIEIY